MNEEFKHSTIEELTKQVFLPGGILSKIFDAYQYREDQMKMALKIATALDKTDIENGKIQNAILEAGTGTGKSFGELVPTAIYIARHNKYSTEKKRAFIVTHTIPLQQQLYEKDLPIIKKILKHFGLELNATLLKGKGNYLCYKKFVNVYKKRDSQPDWVKNSLKKFSDHAINDKNRIIITDLQKLPYQMKTSFSNKISGANSPDCRGCPYRENHCYYYHRLDQSIKADLMFGNHALLMADIMARKKGYNSNVPEYHMVVIDEAHHIEDVASGFLGNSVKSEHIINAINYLISTFKKSNYPDGHKNKYRMRIDQTLEILEKFKIELSDVFKKVYDSMKNSSDGYWDQKLDLPYKTYELLIRNLTMFSTRRKQFEKAKIFYASLNKYSNLMRNIWDEIEDFSRQKEPLKNIYWVSKSGYKDVLLNSTPVSIKEDMNEYLFSKKPVVLTSATISLNNSLELFAKKIGDLKRGEYEEILIPAPFDYQNKVCTYIPTDALSSNDEGYDEYTIKEMFELTKMSGGRAFLLFTAKQSMNDHYKVLAPKFEKLGFTVFKQGERDRSQLIEMFKSAHRPVLFGADTFWEGVDVPGNNLSLVVVHKLPFAPPTPISKTRMDMSTSRNSFLEYAIFPALVQFAQGFGRLIRHEEDSGVFAILDNRVLTMNYGEHFLKKLPKTQYEVYRKNLFKHLR